MSTMSQFFGGGATIKSIQRGVISVSGFQSSTATISTVNTAKTELRLLGFTDTTASGLGPATRIMLTDSTTVTATRSYGNGDGNISWELTEWN